MIVFQYALLLLVMTRFYMTIVAAVVVLYIWNVAADDVGSVRSKNLDRMMFDRARPLKHQPRSCCFWQWHRVISRELLRDLDDQSMRMEWMPC